MRVCVILYEMENGKCMLIYIQTHTGCRVLCIFTPFRVMKSVTRQIVIIPTKKQLFQKMKSFEGSAPGILMLITQSGKGSQDSYLHD